MFGGVAHLAINSSGEREAKLDYSPLLISRVLRRCD